MRGRSANESFFTSLSSKTSEKNLMKSKGAMNTSYIAFDFPEKKEKKEKKKIRQKVPKRDPNDTLKFLHCLLRKKIKRDCNRNQWNNFFYIRNFDQTTLKKKEKNGNSVIHNFSCVENVSKEIKEISVNWKLTSN